MAIELLKSAGTLRFIYQSKSEELMPRKDTTKHAARIVSNKAEKYFFHRMVLYFDMVHSNLKRSGVRFKKGKVFFLPFPYEGLQSRVSLWNTYASTVVSSAVGFKMQIDTWNWELRAVCITCVGIISKFENL